MKTKLLLFLFLSINTSIFAQSSYDAAFMTTLRTKVMQGQEEAYEQWEAFEGLIGQEKRVYFLLNTYIFNPKETKIWGEYLYAAYNSPIKLEGALIGSKVYLKEFIKGKHTGTLIFDIHKDTGEWTNDKGISYPIHIEGCPLRTYVQQYYSDRSRDIQNKNFKSFVKRYTTNLLPNFVPLPTYSDKEKRISSALAVSYLHGSYDGKDFTENEAGYLYGSAFFTEKYIYLFTVEYYGGIAGVNREDILLHIFDYKGNLKDISGLGCNCSDIDMGIDADHGSTASVLVDWNRITVFSSSQSNYMALDRERQVKDSEVDYYKVSSSGELVKY